MEKWASGEGEGKEKYLTKYLITIQDGGSESLIYLAFLSKITAALQAMVKRPEIFPPPRVLMF